MARAIQPDLLVLDGALEDGEGIEVCRLLRSERVNTPVIMSMVEDSAHKRVQRGGQFQGSSVFPNGGRGQHLLYRWRSSFA